jgi:hypothetical protein
VYIGLKVTVTVQEEPGFIVGAVEPQGVAPPFTSKL